MVPIFLVIFDNFCDWWETDRLVSEKVTREWSDTDMCCTIMSVTSNLEERWATMSRMWPPTCVDEVTCCLIPNKLRSSWNLIVAGSREILLYSLQLYRQIDYCSHLQLDKNKEIRRLQSK